jgi:hypothetical protein
MSGQAVCALFYQCCIHGSRWLPDSGRHQDPHRHGLATSDRGPWDLGAEIGGVLEPIIPSLTGFFPVLGFQRHWHPLFGVIILVDGVVAPVGAIVVPNVVVWVGAA